MGQEYDVAVEGRAYLLRPDTPKEGLMLLGDLTVIQGLARAVSLDADELMERLNNHHYSETVMGQYQEALKYGIQGIPTFLVGNLIFTGAHPYEIFQSAMTKVLEGDAENPAA